MTKRVARVRNARVRSRSGFRHAALAVVYLLCGCSEGFEVDDTDGGTSRRDGAAADASFPDAPAQDTTFVDASGDASTPQDRCEPPNPCAGLCELPWLLATAQDVFGDARCGGRVFRYSLSEAGACACTGYQTRDDDYPTTVSYIPGGTVLVGTSARMFTFGGARSELYLDGNGAVDSFIVEGEAVDSAPVGVLLAGRAGAGGGKRIYVVSADGVIEAQDFGDPTTITTDNVTQDPNNRRGFRASELNYPSINRLFWEDRVEDLMHFADGQRGKIEAFYADGLHRTVVSGSQGVRHVANETRLLNNTPAPLTCQGADYEGCRYGSAAPDPISRDHVYVACEQSIDDRQASRIVRLNVNDDSCVDLLPFEHWRRIRITHLSVGMESYWAP
ncbi:MAG: hypothetical protein AB8H86_09650 [Polyangiales bacterium]